MNDKELLDKYKNRAIEVLGSEIVQNWGHSKGSHVLCYWVEKFKIKTFVEVGSQTGNQVKILAETFPDLKIIAIDINHLNLNLEKEYKNIRQITCCSWDAANFYEDDTLDLVYIDADHSYESVVKDLRAWYPKIKKYGIICGHDYNHPQFQGCKNAIDEFIDQSNLLINCEDYYNWWAIKK